MKVLLKLSSFFLGSALLAMSATASANDSKSYDVTITNITHGETFTPILVATHKKGQHLFRLGKPASTELAQVAEGGDTGPLAAYLKDYGIAYDTVSSGALLAPGDSVTVRVRTQGQFRYISVVSMLIPTNDAFFAVNNIKAPNKYRMVMANTYDAGSELNDELCANMPGPFCGGEGYNPNDGEGFVHIHPGVSGVGDLTSGQFNWNNPTARVVIKAVSTQGNI